MSIKHFVLTLVLVFGISYGVVGSTPAMAAGTTGTDTNAGQVQTQNTDGSLNLTTSVNTATASTTPNPDLEYLPPGFAKSFPDLLASILTLLVAIVAILVFAYLIWGGLNWITSGGDKGKTETARNKIMAALIGLIIIASSYAVLQIVLRFLGYSSLIDAFNKIKPISEPGRNLRVELTVEKA